MKIKVGYTIELDEDQRKAIGYAIGKPLGETATYDELQQFYKKVLDAHIRDAATFPLREYYREMGAKYSTMAEEQKSNADPD